MPTPGPIPGPKRLVILGCSADKVQSDSTLPAVSLYNGPTFRVLRNFLKAYRWPESLSIAVLSAKYGMIGGLSRIACYDQRMTPARAIELSDGVNKTLQQWGTSHARIDLVLGQDYLGSIDRTGLPSVFPPMEIVEGPIGIKLNRLHGLLRSLELVAKPSRKLPELKRPLYFLPDWDDFLDVGFDFKRDAFSSTERATRHEEHSIALMRPRQLCDGVLVSLAQNLGTKGLLKRVAVADDSSLSPRSVRDHFKLEQTQWAFGDCGAFSYAGEDKPTISVDQAVSLYELHDFDLGASVDHIPLPEIQTEHGRQTLTMSERRRRVSLTRDNAERFLRAHRERGATFLPVGVIQGLGPRSYACQVADYLDMGYGHLALGGLVPRSDADVRAIVDAVDRKLKRIGQRPWIHLLGIFRPTLQPHFRELGIGSFDSASYFRKAWLRSDQNYLGVNGKWYAAIRVPPLGDPRTMKRMMGSGVDEATLLRLEREALKRLRAFDKGIIGLERALTAVLEYDRLLSRSEEIDDHLARSYRKTLEDRPWRGCSCPMCSIGIDIVIFRGINRNKRRGAHNTLRLFEQVAIPSACGGS